MMRVEAKPTYLSAITDRYVIKGEATMNSPGALVPQMERGDATRDPASDYTLVREDLERAGDRENRALASTAMCWIRRCVHSEEFAKALEKELETLRRR
jgi:hypothetical protein